ncbi:MAG: hypothetical protein O9270_11010 [Aquidulcibacter sp.]|nr:hypothetical protein [Aquidulcibacter sp.]MCZ8208705.1 hypothetical protein [Aquidulcibacter sp.]
MKLRLAALDLDWVRRLHTARFVKFDNICNASDAEQERAQLQGMNAPDPARMTTLWNIDRLVGNMSFGSQTIIDPNALKMDQCSLPNAVNCVLKR